MAQKRKLHKVLSNGTKEQIYLQTTADQVIFEAGASGIDATDVNGAIIAVKAIADNGGVTGVKGSEEASYRTGNVSISAANVGAMAASSKFGKTIDLAYNSTNGVVTATLKDQDGTVLSTDTVDLPLELIVSSGSVKTCATANNPVSGYVIGDKYIDLVLANGSHIYIKATDFVDQITISNSGTGNAVTAISISGTTLTVTKGKTFVETSRTVNGKPLSSDITLSAEDVGALASDANAAAANKLATARTLSLSGDATGSASFDGSANKDIAVTLASTGVAAGVYTAVQVDVKGRVLAGNQAIEWGVANQSTPSATTMAGGIFFELQ